MLNSDPAILLRATADPRFFPKALERLTLDDPSSHKMVFYRRENPDQVSLWSCRICKKDTDIAQKDWGLIRYSLFFKVLLD
jgi:hypothetical protein